MKLDPLELNYLSTINRTKLIIFRVTNYFITIIKYMSSLKVSPVGIISCRFATRLV